MEKTPLRRLRYAKNSRIVTDRRWETSLEEINAGEEFPDWIVVKVDGLIETQHIKGRHELAIVEKHPDFCVYTDNNEWLKVWKDTNPRLWQARTGAANWL